jgi:hypothetical protein
LEDFPVADFALALPQTADGALSLAVAPGKAYSAEAPRMDVVGGRNHKALGTVGVGIQPAVEAGNHGSTNPEQLPPMVTPLWNPYL